MSKSVLAFAGSTRSDSFNRKLLHLAATQLRDRGISVTEVELRDYPLPLYDGDLEASGGLPENGKKLREIFLAHSALLVASPEYNGSVTGVLKNSLDWLSRPVSGFPPLDAFAGKTATIMGASPGPYGAIRSLMTLRQILAALQVIVLPDQLTLMRASEAFDESGKLTDPRNVKGLDRVCQALASHLKKSE